MSKIYLRIFLKKNFFTIIAIIILFSAENYAVDRDGNSDSTKVKSDEDSKPLTVGFNFHYGLIIPHAKEVVNVEGSHPKGYELNFSWQLNTKEVWDDCHCYPRLGFLLAFYDYGLPDVLGYGYGTALDFTYFLGLPEDFNFLVKGKAGIIYLTKPYDGETHTDNMSYSTYFNYLLSAGAGIYYKPSSHFELQLVLSMNHQSNAAFLEPNGGINFPAITFGAGYIIDPVQFKPRTHPDPYLTSEKKKRWDISAFWGISGMTFPDESQVPMYGLTILRSIQVNRFGAISFAGELEMNGRARLLVQRGTIEDVSPYRGSLLFGYEFLMGKTIFNVQLGAYVYRPYKEKDDIFQRIGLVHRFFDSFYFGINFKSYRNFADHLDLRLTYSF